jgi:hypothetical protein
VNIVDNVDQADIWSHVDKLVNRYLVVIDHPIHSAHPAYSYAIPPLDDGFLEGAQAMDGSPIGEWVGPDPDCYVGGCVYNGSGEDECNSKGFNWMPA